MAHRYNFNGNLGWNRAGILACNVFFSRRAMTVGWKKLLGPRLLDTESHLEALYRMGPFRRTGAGDRVLITEEPFLVNGLLRINRL